MIPKVIHHIWTSGNEFLEKFHSFRLSWMKCNPDYTFHFWTLDNMPFDKFTERGAALLRSNLNYESKADVAEMEILYLFGGVKVSPDVICQKSFNDLLKCGSFTSRSSDGHHDYCDCVIGFEKGNKILADMMDAVYDAIIKNPTVANSKDLWKYCYSPMMAALGRCELILPEEAFSPFNIFNLDKRFSHFPGSYCVHWWCGMDQDGWSHMYDSTGGKGEVLKI